MTQLENEMLNELEVAQGFTNDLAANLTAKGVPSSNTEGLDTLVPKVLEIERVVQKAHTTNGRRGLILIGTVLYKMPHKLGLCQLYTFIVKSIQ